MGRLYVFRPDFSEFQRQDRPVLTVDGSTEVTVARSSYSVLDLPMGQHTFTLAPGPGDSPVWHLEGTFEFSAEGPFYLAVWNSDASVRAVADYGTYAKDVTKAMAIGTLTAVMTGGFAMFPLPTVRSVSKGASEARFELIPEEQALEVLRQCELAPARPRPSDAGQGQP